VLTGSPGWAIIFGGLGGAGLWGLLINYDPSKAGKDD
jgi:hypothetical protein